MIKNSKEYEKVKEQLKDWAKTFNQMKEVLSSSDYAIYLEAHEPIVSELHESIREYDAIQSGLEHPDYFLDPLGVGKRLVQARIRSECTQQKLAEKIRVTQAQVSRAEDDEYSSAPLARLHEIASALGLALITLLIPKNQEQLFVASIRGLMFEYQNASYQATIKSSWDDYSLSPNSSSEKFKVVLQGGLK